jgi:hypothetical protein
MIKKTTLFLAFMAGTTGIACASDMEFDGAADKGYSPATVRKVGTPVTMMNCASCGPYYSEYSLEGRNYTLGHACSTRQGFDEYANIETSAHIARVKELLAEPKPFNSGVPFDIVSPLLSLDQIQLLEGRIAGFYGNTNPTDVFKQLTTVSDKPLLTEQYLQTLDLNTAALQLPALHLDQTDLETGLFQTLNLNTAALQLPELDPELYFVQADIDPRVEDINDPSEDK